MKTGTLFALGLSVALLLPAINGSKVQAAPAASGAPAAASSSAPAKVKGNVEHGKYLVEICTCDDCHTPSLKNGEPDMKHRLQGTTLFVKPLGPVPDWAKKSADIAGLKGWTDEQAIKFFTGGADRKGKHPRPPMNTYHFSEQDARDLVAFLRTLKP